MAVDFWYASAIEALTALKDYELQENVRYVVLSREKEFGQSDIPDKRVKVHWNSDGQPFIVVGNKRFGCHHGHDKNAKRKQRKKASVVKESTHNYCKKRRRHPIIETKKVGCPAKVIMKEVLFFPQFKAEERRRAKTMLAARVRSNLHDGERRIIMEFKNDHENHPLGEVEGLSQRIDPDISYKIKDLAEVGVNDVGEMARHIENYVRESLQQVNLSPLNRRVHPLNRTIRYHMGKGRKGPDVQDDQLSLSALMQEEKSSHPNDVIFLRNKNSTSIDGHSEKFLMVYQSKWMKEMLVKYGNSMTLLDSTYKTTKYTLPMFVLAVRTNVDHQVVCVFIVDDESVSTLVEAISVVRENNPAWNPSHYMTDCDEKEMAAMERHFPASRGLICDFHRSQAWHRFIAKGSNRITKKKDTFQQLQGLAWARTLEEFNRRLNQLQKTDNWKQLGAYFTKQWLPLKEKWAQYCRTGELLVGVHTNNGLERLHGVLKNVYLKRNSRMSLTSMVSIMVKKFFPDKQQRYIEANLAPQGKNYAPEVPSFLHGRPTKFIKHCMDRMNEARLLERQM